MITLARIQLFLTLVRVQLTMRALFVLEHIGVRKDVFCLNAILVFNRCSRILESNVFLSLSALPALLAEVSTAGHVTSGVGEPWSRIFNSNRKSLFELHAYIF